MNALISSSDNTNVLLFTEGEKKPIEIVITQISDYYDSGDNTIIITSIRRYIIRLENQEAVDKAMKLLREKV